MDIKKMYDLIGGNCLFFDWISFYGEVQGSEAYDYFSKVNKPFDQTIKWAETMDRVIIQN